jgi:hypothetical protein
MKTLNLNEAVIRVNLQLPNIITQSDVVQLIVRHHEEVGGEPVAILEFSGKYFIKQEGKNQLIKGNFRLDNCVYVNEDINGKKVSCIKLKETDEVPNSLLILKKSLGNTSVNYDWQVLDIDNSYVIAYDKQYCEDYTSCVLVAVACDKAIIREVTYSSDFTGKKIVCKYYYVYVDEDKLIDFNSIPAKKQLKL